LSVQVVVCLPMTPLGPTLPVLIEKVVRGPKPPVADDPEKGTSPGPVVEFALSLTLPDAADPRGLMLCQVPL